jgi:hypothetical protein
MMVYRYRTGRLVGDYLRCGFGLAGLIAAWVLLPSGPRVDIVMGGLTLPFLLFTIRTVWRQTARIEVSDQAITLTSLRLAFFNQGPMAWRDLVSIKLRYYSTRRNRKNGWFTMHLAGPTARIAFDSDLDGFEDMARRAALAARDNGIATDDTTRANLAALGFADQAPWHPERDGVSP